MTLLKKVLQLMKLILLTKIYSGPAYLNHKNGERKEKGNIVNGAKTGVWSGWDDKGNLIYKGKSKNSQRNGNNFLRRKMLIRKTKSNSVS